MFVQSVAADVACNRGACVTGQDTETQFLKNSIDGQVHRERSTAFPTSPRLWALFQLSRMYRCDFYVRRYAVRRLELICCHA